MTFSTLILTSALVASTLVNGASLPYRLPRRNPVALPAPTVRVSQIEEAEPIRVPDFDFSPKFIRPQTNTPTTTEPVVEVEQSLTCTEQNQGSTFTYTTSGGAYDILCGQDYLDGDMSSTPAATFEDCLTACDAQSTCVTVAFANGICYLKNKVTTPVANYAVWSAKKQGVKRGLSCDNKIDDGITYQATKGQFKIVCGQEYSGGDLASTGTASFEECIEACVGNEKCVDVSYVNGACYLKHTKSAELISAGNVWTAELIGTQTSVKVDEFTCINGEANGKTYTATNGGKYKIECGVDYAGGDLLTVDSTTTFQTCMDACDATTGCIDVSWVWGSCYLKNEVNTATELSHVWTGRQVKVEELTCIDGEANGKTYTAKNGGKYQVECGIDYAGGDLLTVDSMTTFQTCMDACDATTGCIDVSWVTGSCYLKNELTTALELSHVSTGRRVDTDNSPVPDKDTATKTGALSCRYGSSFAIGVTNPDTRSYLGRIKLHQVPDHETAGVLVDSFVPKTDTTAARFRLNGAGILEDDETRGTAAFYWEDAGIAKVRFGGAGTSDPQGSCWRSTEQPDAIMCSTTPGNEMFTRMSTCPNPALPGNAMLTGITIVFATPAACNPISFSVEDEVCNPPPQVR